MALCINNGWCKCLDRGLNPPGPSCPFAMGAWVLPPAISPALGVAGSPSTRVGPEQERALPGRAGALWSGSSTAPFEAHCLPSQVPCWAWHWHSHKAGAGLCSGGEFPRRRHLAARALAPGACKNQARSPGDISLPFILRSGDAPLLCHAQVSGITPKCVFVCMLASPQRVCMRSRSLCTHPAVPVRDHAKAAMLCLEGASA